MLQYEWQIQPYEKNLSLFDLLRRKFCPAKFSNRKVKGFIDAGYCFIQGRCERFSKTRLIEGSKVELCIPQSTKTTSSVLFEDDTLLVINKAAALTCDARLIRSLHKDHGPLFLVHRLDKETTGALLLAKNQTSFDALKQQFQQRDVQKRYLALVDGIIKPKGSVENFLAPIQRGQGFVKWGEKSGGLWASTRWMRLAAQKNASLVALYPKTGRTHQLRVHLAGMQHPILADFVYGEKFQCSFKATRQLLHAYELGFVHPQTQKTMHIQAPLADDIKAAIQELFGDKACEYV